MCIRVPPLSYPWLSAGQHVCPLSRCTYILDVASEMEQVDGGYMLWFRRVLWDQPLKFENELYVTMHYNQVSRATLMLWKLPGFPRHLRSDFVALAFDAFMIRLMFLDLVPLLLCVVSLKYLYDVTLTD